MGSLGNIIGDAVGSALGTSSGTGLEDFLSNFGSAQGKWVTDPIVSPYIKIGKKQKIGIDFGHLLKGFIWGNREDMIPRGPVRMPPPPGNK